jgi:hypothetical protein
VQVTFANGYTAEVKRLGIFELDKLPKPDLGSYRYKLKTLGGEVLEQEYDPFAYEEQDREPPTKPEKPEHAIEFDSQEWHQLHTWRRHQAALIHHDLRLKSMQLYFEAIVAYILTTCISSEALEQMSEEDWPLVYESALIEPVSMELIDQVLKDTYEAEYAGRPIFDARKELPESLASYNVLRVWENQLANELKVRDEELALWPAVERARRIVAMKIDKWMESLEMDTERRKRKAEELERASKNKA